MRKGSGAAKPRVTVPASQQSAQLQRAPAVCRRCGARAAVGEDGFCEKCGMALEQACL